MFSRHCLDRQIAGGEIGQIQRAVQVRQGLVGLLLRRLASRDCLVKRIPEPGHPLLQQLIVGLGDHYVVPSTSTHLGDT